MHCVFWLHLFISGILGSSADTDQLSERIEELAYSWSQEFEQYKDYQRFLSGSIHDFKLLISQARTRRHYFPLVLGDKLEQMELIFASLNNSTAPCPPGAFSAPFLPLLGEIGRLCVRSSRDIVSDFIKWDGYLEDCRRAVQEALVSETGGQSCDLVVDVGANIGACSIDFALADFRVLAIEPNPFSFQLLGASARLNAVTDKVVMLRAAVSANADEEAFFVEPAENAGGSFRVQGLGQASSDRGTKIFSSRTVLLSDILGTSECVRLLKLDCEGCEADAIRDLHRNGQLDKIHTVKLELTADHISLDNIGEVLNILSFNRSLFVYSASGKRVDIVNYPQALKLLEDNGIIDVYAVRQMNWV